VTSLLDRIAGAPISWGVCEVPDWGIQLPAHQVLSQAAAIGLRAIELGPEGFLPTDPQELRAVLAPYDLRIVAGFVPLILHRPELLADQLALASRAAATLAGIGAQVVVVGPDDAGAGYERHPEMDGEAWGRFLVALGRVEELAGAAGLRVALHPHWGMVIERPHDVERLLERSAVGICIDTGHLALGGSDPLKVVDLALERVVHVHLKDLDEHLAAEVRSGARGYRDAVAAGLYPPVGSGDLDLAAVVRHLERNGYRGWYVIEQDRVLTEPPSSDRGPMVDVGAGYAFLRGLADGEHRHERSPDPPTDAEGGRAHDAPSNTERGGMA